MCQHKAHAMKSADDTPHHAPRASDSQAFGEQGRRLGYLSASYRDHSKPNGRHCEAECIAQSASQAEALAEVSFRALEVIEMLQRHPAIAQRSGRSQFVAKRAPKFERLIGQLESLLVLPNRARPLREVIQHQRNARLVPQKALQVEARSIVAHRRVEIATFLRYVSE